jgi:phage baseplate assembly protein V
MDYDSDSVFPVNKTGRDSEIRNIFRHGKVTEVLVDATQVCVRVQYLDKDGLISKPLPVKQFGSRSTSAFWCPKVGDDVSVTMLPNGDEDGFVDGSFYNTGNPPPIVDPNTRHITFADGTIIEYAEGPPASGRAGGGGGTFKFTSAGPINIICGMAVIQAATITLQADVHITGALTVDGYTTLNQGGIAKPKMTNSDGSGNGS